MNDHADPAAIAALRGDAALCRHATRFLVRATGRDLLPWLERIASLPVANMPAGGVVALTLMDGKGKLRADPRVIAPGPPADGLLLDLPASQSEAVLRLLRMYVITDDVTLDDLSTRLELVTLAGPRAAEQLASAGLPVPDEGRVARATDDVLVLASELTGVGGFDLLGPTDALASALAKLTAAGVPTVDRDALDVVRVAAGVPWFAPDLADGVIPLEALLERKVSSTKGCYPGQEVVARITNLGQVARRLVRLRAPGRQTLEAGAELTGGDGRVMGTLTSAAYDPTADATLALGYAKRASWSSGAELLAGDVSLVVESLAD